MTEHEWLLLEVQSHFICRAPRKCKILLAVYLMSVYILLIFILRQNKLVCAQRASKPAWGPPPSCKQALKNHKICPTSSPSSGDTLA